MNQHFSRRTLIKGAGAFGPALLAQHAPVRVGIIGLGSRSRSHLAGLGQLAGAQIAALSDLDSTRIDRVNASLPAKAAAYTDYRELIRDKSVSAVVIVAPNYLHHQMAIEALRAGKDVLVEKPIAISYPLALEVAREARRSGRILAVGMQRRYTKPDAEVHQLVDRGTLGKIHLFTYDEFRGDWNAAGWKYTDPATGQQTNWRYLKKTAGSSELELSVHTFAMACALVKSPLARVTATGGLVHYRDRETRDVSAALVDFENGARLSYSFSLFAPGGGSSMTLVGERGTLQRGSGQLTVFGKDGKPLPVDAPAVPAESAEVQMYREFLQSVRERKPSVLGPETAIEAAKIAYAIDMSIAENRIVTAKDFPAL